ncbi:MULTISPECIES: hypothetical protein [unclassified Streptomyces]|uniref:hypothetical protein n=1 Tax=unclassified Streptomyces TaxID=2593676 RepID=UPI0035DE90FA
MQTRQASRVASLADDNVHLPLTARLAASLLALPEVKVRYRGQHLTRQTCISRDVDLNLDLDPVILKGKARPRLRVVEWSVDMRSKTLHLCDERGGMVTEHKLGRMPPAPIHWTSYLQHNGAAAGGPVRCFRSSAPCAGHARSAKASALHTMSRSSIATSNPTTS